MAFVNVPLRFLSRRSIFAADLESVCASLVSQIGGTWYSGGVKQGPTNGNLDFRNFAPDAGISNQFKANKFAIFPIAIICNTTINGTNIVISTPLPGGTQVLPDGITVIGVTLTALMASAVNSGSAQFAIARPSGNVALGTLISWTNSATGPTVLSSQTLANPIQILPRDLLQVTLTNNVNTVFAPHVWVKALHVR